MDHPIKDEQVDLVTPEMSIDHTQHLVVMTNLPPRVVIQAVPTEVQPAPGSTEPMYAVPQVKSEVLSRNPGQHIQPQTQTVVIKNKVHKQMEDVQRQTQIIHHSAVTPNQTTAIGKGECDVLVQGVSPDLVMDQGEIIMQDEQQVVYVTMQDGITDQNEEVEIIVTTHHLSTASDTAMYDLQGHENQYQGMAVTSRGICGFNTDTTGVQSCQGTVGSSQGLVSLPTLAPVSSADAIYNSAVSSGILPSVRSHVDYCHYSPTSTANLTSTFQATQSETQSLDGLSRFHSAQGKYAGRGDPRVAVQTVYVEPGAVLEEAVTASPVGPEYTLMTPREQELYEKQETLRSLELVEAQWQSALEGSQPTVLQTAASTPEAVAGQTGQRSGAELDTGAVRSLEMVEGQWTSAIEGCQQISASTPEAVMGQTGQRLGAELDTGALSSLATVAASVDQNGVDSVPVTENFPQGLASDNHTDAFALENSMEEKGSRTISEDPKLNLSKEVVENAYFFKEKVFPEEEEELYCCRKCGVGFVDIAQLNKHVLSEHGRSFKCEECYKTFTTNTYLKSHMRCHTGEKIHKCDVCGENFTFSNTLRRHRLKFHKEAMWKCEDCDEEFASQVLFKRHVHGHAAAARKPKRGRPPKNRAKRDTKISVSKSKMTRPSIANRPQTRALQKKQELLKSPTGGRMLTCILCQEKFRSKILLKKHARTHLGHRILRCDKCGKVFQDSIKLKMHKLTHKSQSYPCEFCGRSFTYACTLSVHRKSHAGEKGHKCKQCAKRFASVELLNVHKACHAAVKAFVCDICEKAFSSQHYLKTHLKMHTGDNYYGCMLCGESFRLSSWLRKHVQKCHGFGRGRKKLRKTSSGTGDRLPAGGEAANGDVGGNRDWVLQDGSLDVVAHRDADGMLQCTWCDKKLQSKPAFNTHIKMHVDFPFSCDKCDKTFSQEMYLQKHRQRHEDTPLHYCTYCEKGFRSATYLQQHKLIHTGQKLYQCQLCDEEFVFATSLRRHLKTHDGIGPNKSGLVKKRKLKSIPVSEDGEAKDGTPPNLNCTLCGLLFTDAQQIEEHVQMHRGENPVFECSLCQKEFRSHRALWRHRQFHVDNAPISCLICDKTFRTSYYLKSHMNVHSGTKPYQCQYCDESFTHASTRRRHQRVHISEEQMNHMCNICGKKFFDQSDFDRHMLNHTGEKEFMCDICGKTFASKALLKSHLNRHNGERQYRCTICNKSFLHQYRLQRHYLTHSDVKAYQCTMCDKRFHLEAYLQTHLRSHTGEKPYRCEICKGEFTHSNTFRRHKRIHEGKTLNCKVCGKMCLELFDLKRHMQSHSEEKPVICNICGKTFSHQGSCKRHLRRIHSEVIAPFPVEEVLVQGKVQETTVEPITLSMALAMPNSLESVIAVTTAVPPLTVASVATEVGIVPMMAATVPLTTLMPLTSVAPPITTTHPQAVPAGYPQSADTIVVSL